MPRLIVISDENTCTEKDKKLFSPVNEDNFGLFCYFRLKTTKKSWQFSKIMKLNKQDHEKLPILGIDDKGYTITNH